jgi:hypothetical protein
MKRPEWRKKCASRRQNNNYFKQNNTKYQENMIPNLGMNVIQSGQHMWNVHERSGAGHHPFK